MVDPIRGLKNEIYHLIENEQYFLIHAPRQSGKTTLLHALTKKINSEGRYIAVTFSMESAGYRSITVEKAMYSCIISLYETAKNFLPPNELPPVPEKQMQDENLLFQYLTNWSQLQTKPIVLFIDEIDSIWDDKLISTLRQLRNGFQIRPKRFPVSVALVGLRDIREYKTKVREMDGELGSGSPFNIKAESFRIANFSEFQIKELFSQYTEETGQIFNDLVINHIFTLTGGQPWLVNALANEIVVKILKNDFSKEITSEIVETAKENLIQRRDTHLDSLLDKLKEDRVKNIVQAVIAGDNVTNDRYNDDLQYTLDLGIINRSPQAITISNKIYAEIITRILSTNFQDNIIPLISPLWFIKDNRLDMDALLKEFQKFYRRHSESWIDKFSYQEAGKQLLLMAFLQRVVNGGGKIDREMAYGRCRTDLTIEFNHQIFIVEMKINYDQFVREEGLVQLSEYLDKSGSKEGYLVLFEKKSSKEIPWEQRIKWEVLDYEWQGVKRKITIVEM
jgi:hypothetical protein